MRVEAAVEKAIKEDAMTKFVTAAAAAFKHCGRPCTAYVFGRFSDGDTPLYGNMPIRAYARMPPATLVGRLRSLEPSEGQPESIVVDFTRNDRTEGYLAFRYDTKTGVASAYMGDGNGHRVGKFGVKSLTVRAMATHFVKVIKVLERYNAEIFKAAEALLAVKNSIAPELQALKLNPGNPVEMIKRIYENANTATAAAEPQKLQPDQAGLRALRAAPATEVLGTFLTALAVYLHQAGYAEGYRQCLVAADSAAFSKVVYVTVRRGGVFSPMLRIEKITGGAKIGLDRFSGHVRISKESVAKIPQLVQALVQDVKDLDAGVEAGFQVFRGLQASRTKALFPDSDIRCDSTSLNTLSRYY